jgi:hypothetical protein
MKPFDVPIFYLLTISGNGGQLISSINEGLFQASDMISCLLLISPIITFPYFACGILKEMFYGRYI